MMSENNNGENITINIPIKQEYKEILTLEALKFIAALHENFESTRQSLLRERQRKQKEIISGKLPDFLPETKHIRESNWKVAKIPNDLLDRRVEITGPVSRKMIINALNSGAKVFMADFEDANSPTWDNNIEGQINLKDAVNRTISFQNPEGKKYQLNKDIATLMVRPRGWHLSEYHMSVGLTPISASLFDFGLFFFHNAKTLLKMGSGPYFYLPKIESYLEARLWRDVFNFSEKYIGIPHGTIRATVLIETILAAFQMDEILFELKDYSAGLNCGRWDYIFSFIKKFYEFPEFVLPDRSQITMTQPFMNSYVQLLIQTCHKRGIHAMGGMAAQIPSSDKEKNKIILEKVAEDKIREVKAGHDGTWVAHPGLIPTTMEIFNKYMPKQNQIDFIPNVLIISKDLLQIPSGTKTMEGLRLNIEVSLLYMVAWLKGLGCIPIQNLMEDFATAEICRTQVQQWMKHKVSLTDGTLVTPSLIKNILNEEINKLLHHSKNKNIIKQVKEIFEQIFFNSNGEFYEFMSLIAYPYIVNIPSKL